MNFETLFSIAMLGAFIWAVRFLLPKARCPTTLRTPRPATS